MHCFITGIIVIVLSERIILRTYNVEECNHNYILGIACMGIVTQYTSFFNCCFGFGFNSYCILYLHVHLCKVIYAAYHDEALL